MISKLNLENILFLDIETVPETEHFSDLDSTKQELWDAKSRYQRKEEFSAEEFYDRAGIWAEFGKIICSKFNCKKFNCPKVSSTMSAVRSRPTKPQSPRKV